MHAVELLTISQPQRQMFPRILGIDALLIRIYREHILMLSTTHFPRRWPGHFLIISYRGQLPLA